MSLTKLAPNKTLVWKELKNSMALIIGLWLGITFVSSFMLINGQVYEVLTILQFNTWGVGLYSTLGVIALAALMMGQERDHNTFNLLLAMPYSRQDIIYNKFIVGMGQILMIFTINALIMTVFVLANPSIEYIGEVIELQSFGIGVAEIWVWALHNILVLGFVFAFTMLISTVSGTTLGNGLLSLIFLFFPTGILSLLWMNADLWYGSISFYNRVLEAAGLLTVPLLIMDGGYISYLGQEIYTNLKLLYWISISVLIGCMYKLTQYLFSKNQLENNGEVLMFNQLEGFFKFGVTACFTLLGGAIIIVLFNLQHQPIGFISYLLAGYISWVMINKVIKWQKAV